MRLSLQSTGGFTGSAGAQTRTVDVDDLPASERTRVQALVQALDVAHLPATLLKPRPQPWDFTYTLKVDNGMTRQVRFHLDAAPAPLRELVGILEARPPD
jgi:hypothetical protein